MTEFEDNRVIYKQAKRGTYVIVPLKYNANIDFNNIQIDKSEETEFFSDDMSTILIQKCKTDKGFVKSFVLNNKMESLKLNNVVNPIDQIQLFVFNNGIAFLTLLLTYDNVDTHYIYELIQPGYMKNVKNDLQQDIILYAKNICVNAKKSFFKLYSDSENLIVKESYFFNLAIVEKRFKDLDTLNKATFNVHKYIDISRDFIDESEKDIAYTYGARDVEKCTYRWGACISSQSISYVYAIENQEITVSDIIKTSKNDLLLTMLVLFQKNTCMLLNEKIYSALYDNKNKNYLKSIIKLKKEALEFRSVGTLAPSQVSRWNNVCETYRQMLIVNGIEEALTEIEQKIDLIKDENDSATSRTQNYIGTVIAVFGLISIIESILSVVQMIEEGSLGVILSFIISCLGVITFGSWWILIKRKKK